MDGNAANFDQLPEPKWWCCYSVAVSLTLEIDAHLLARSAEPDSLERPSHSRTRRPDRLPVPVLCNRHVSAGNQTVIPPPASAAAPIMCGERPLARHEKNDRR